MVKQSLLNIVKQLDQIVPDHGNTFIHVYSASAFQHRAFKTIVDLQEWLKGDTVHLPLQRRVDGDLKTQSVRVSRRDLVLSVANTQGAHFDEDDPDTLALMDQFKSADVSITMSILLHVASLVIELGKYVLVQAETQLSVEP